MIPLAVPDLSGNEARYLQECVDTTFVSSVGPFVGRFEEMVAEASGAAAAVATCSGTAALHLALATIGVGRDDLVVVPALSFIATANAVAYCGAEPWFVDIEPGRWGLCPAGLAEALSRHTRRAADGALRRTACGRRVAAILPVYALGCPAEMDAIVAVAREFRLPVIADAAAALGSADRGRRVARLGADLTAFSFNGNKTVTAGGGGMVVGDDAALLGRARHLSTTARSGADYTHDAVGFNYRLTNLQAAVGCAQMERLEALVGRKRRIAAAYAEAFAGLPGIGGFPAPAGVESACWFSGFTLDEAHAEAAPGLRDALRAAGIDARPFWRPLPAQPPFAEAPCEGAATAESLSRRIVTLPCSTSLADGDQRTVIAAVLRELAALGIGR